MVDTTRTIGSDGLFIHTEATGGPASKWLEVSHNGKKVTGTSYRDCSGG